MTGEQPSAESILHRISKSLDTWVKVATPFFLVFLGIFGDRWPVTKDEYVMLLGLAFLGFTLLVYLGAQSGSPRPIAGSSWLAHLTQRKAWWRTLLVLAFLVLGYSLWKWSDRAIFNKDPVITFTHPIDGEKIEVDGKYWLWVQAEDEQRDKLSYEWSASAGKLTDSDKASAWLSTEGLTANQKVKIEVEVKDNRGGEDSRILTLDTVRRIP